MARPLLYPRRMELDQPILAAMPMDDSTRFVAEAATELARRLGRPIVPIHAQRDWPPVDENALAADAKTVHDDILAYFGQALDEGLTVAEPIIEPGSATDVVLEAAAKLGAHLIVAGPGRPETVRQWLLGSVAHRLVRHARQPVWLARGTLPTFHRAIACPVDLSPHSRLGLAAALRMARVFEAPLKVIHAVHADRHARLSPKNAAVNADRIDQAEARVREMLEAHDTEGVDVSIEVDAGRPSEVIVEHTALGAQLLVIASRDFHYLLPGAIGSTTEKVIRAVRCSVLTVRDADPERDEREATVQRTVSLRAEAQQALQANDPVQAERLTRLALMYAPMNASLQELLAETLDAQDRGVEAQSARALAKKIRASFS